tara:strand:+ start:12991 stop:14010 length:1020 start_codon:yes stop_codon:yes gene_type:complete
MSKWNSNTELVIGSDTSDFSVLAEQLGMTPPSVKQKNTLARLKIDHQGIKGEAEVKGKKKQIFLVDAGSFVLEDSEGDKVYSEQPTIKLFLQKFMYQKYLSDDNKYIKTVMCNEGSLNSELPDTEGGFNCGRKGGYIKDFDSLPQDAKDLLRNIKRVRVLFGEITMNDALDFEGTDVSDKYKEPIPFIWDIHNKEAYTASGEIMKALYENKELPFNRTFDLDVEERTLATGGKFYIPTFEMGSKKIPFEGKDDPVNNLLKDFADFVNVNNNYVLKEHEANKGTKLPETADVIDIAESKPVKKLNKKKEAVAELENKDENVSDLISTWGKKESSTVDDGD